MTLLFNFLGPEMAVVIFVVILFLIIPIISYWKIFEKAGEPGWHILIPIYNLVVFMKIVNKPWYWALLCLIPYFGIIWLIWSINLMVKKFGKTSSFTLGIIFLAPLFLPILAFGNSEFQNNQSV